MKRILAIITLAVLCIAAGAKERTIKVLAIGNSFSWDAVEQNLHQIAAADGTTLVIGNMYIGGCSIDRHVRNLKADLPEYRYMKISADGSKKVTEPFRLSQAIFDEEWDVVTVQQSSPLSGKPESYGQLSELVDWIRRNAPQAKILFHQTWAYAVGADHPAFKDYGCDQKKMYGDIVSTVLQECGSAGIDGIIPCGTAIQYAREASGDYDFTRDGYHMGLGKGRYTLACTWYEAISGRSIRGNSYLPDGSEEGTAAVSEEERRLIQRAVHRACRKMRLNP